MRCLPLLPFLAIPFSVPAQIWNDTLAARMAHWNEVIARAESMTMEEVMDGEWSINTHIGKALEAVLEVPGFDDHLIDSLLPNGYVNHVRSADGRLWVFQWDERTGGTFHAMDNVVFFRNAQGMGRALFSSAGEGGELWYFGGGYEAIHLLDRTDSTTRYVLIGNVHGCTTCCADMITVIELMAEGLDLAYPAFPSTDGPLLMPTWSLDARCGDVTRFEFDPRKKLLHYSYTTDDLTPVTSENGERTVSGTWRYNGSYFVEE